MKKFLNLLIFFMITITTFSEIKISVDDNSPAVNQNIIFTVEFLNEKKTEYEIEGIEKFKIMSMGSRSNYNTLNNKVKYSKSDIYTLSPYSEGKASLLVIAKSGTKSNKIELEITKEVKKNQDKEQLFLETTKYTRDYYLGEKIPFVEKVIIKKPIGNYSYVSTPIFNDFSIKNVTPRDGRGFIIPKRVTVDGKEQIELVLFRSILEPLSTGEKTIKTGGISISELTEDDKEEFPVYLGFKEMKIDILPLPQEHKPKNFQGVIGKLYGNYKWSENVVDGKKVFVLKLKLYGTVNLDDLKKVSNLDSNKYEVKEEELTYDEHVLDHIYSAEKKYKIVIIPKDQKQEKPPVIIVPYFDPVAKEYKEFKILATSTKNMCDAEFYDINTKENSNKIFSEENNYIMSDEDKEKVETIKLENPKTNEVEKVQEKSTSIFTIIFLIISLLEALYILKLKKDSKK